jgi:hypothetical protein
VASGSTHLQYNAQHEKKNYFFNYTYTMIDIVNMFSTQQFQKKKHVMKWLNPPFNPKVQGFNPFLKFLYQQMKFMKEIHRIFK